MTTYNAYLVPPLPYECPIIDNVFSKQSGGGLLAGTDTLNINGTLRPSDNKPNVYSIIVLEMIVNTDATVISRVPQIFVYDREGQQALKCLFTGIAASQTGIKSGIYTETHVYQGYQATNWVSFAPHSVFVVGNGYIRCVLSNGQAGDTWSVYARVFHENARLGMYIPVQTPDGTPPIPVIPSSFPPARFD